MGILRLLLLACSVMLAACASQTRSEPEAAQSGVQRLYVIACGQNVTKDLSPWTTPADAGKPYEFPVHCYLVKHAKGWLLFDSGLPDEYVDRPEGVPNPRRTSLAFVRKRLADSLREIGVTPADIQFFAMSHMHGDHSGNANLFVHATILLQQAEYDAAFGPEPAKLGFAPRTYDQVRIARHLVKLQGDHDVFGDGSVVLKSTPGHTPGHQSLFVRLPRSGPVLLSADFVHFQSNWDARRVPAINYDRERSQRTMEEMAAFIRETGARLWINHDAEQTRSIPKAPAWID